jgi:hypothetical protein
MLAKFHEDMINLFGVSFVDEEGDMLSRLREIQGMVEEEVGVRLQVHEKSWAIHWGDSSFDQDHRGEWGASILFLEDTEEDLFDCLEVLWDQALEGAADSFS